MENQNQTNTDTAQGQQQAEGTGKTFTQEEVNNIISDRLKREREKLSKEQEEKLNVYWSSILVTLWSKIFQLKRVSIGVAYLL